MAGQGAQSNVTQQAADGANAFLASEEATAFAKQIFEDAGQAFDTDFAVIDKALDAENVGQYVNTAEAAI